MIFDMLDRTKYLIAVALVIIIAAAISVFLLSSDQTESETETERTFAPIYISFASHNEEPGGPNPDFVEDKGAFWEYRQTLLDYAEMLFDQGVIYNFQSDWNFLVATEMYDEGTDSTNGKNIVRYLSEDLGFEVDPHAHETFYSYADVAYLIEQVGVEPSGVAGGFLAAPPKDSKLEYLWEPIEGRMYDYTWQAELGYGGGTRGHVNEEGLWISGMWRPAGNADFLTHDDDAPLPVIGHYKTSWDGVEKLLALQEAGELDPTKMYTATVMLGQHRMNDDSIAEYQNEIEALFDLTQDGRVVWVGLTEALEIWETEYNASPTLLQY